MNDETMEASPLAVPLKGNGGATLKDITGLRFGRLLAINRSGTGPNGEVLWQCWCDCGKSPIYVSHKLRRLQIVSCGCHKSELARRMKTTHGCTKSPIYRTWKGMMARCYKPTRRNYHSYGGRGIRVCERWRDVRNFITDMMPTYVDGLTIDRINVNGNYEPSNCRWATSDQQHNNKTTSRYITALGKTQTVSQWMRETGLCHSTITYRFDKGWQADLIMTTPGKKHVHPSTREIGKRRKSP